MKEEKYIDIKKLIGSKNPKLLKWMPWFVLRYLKRILREDGINDFMKHHQALKNEEFCHAVIKFFNIKISASNLENIPAGSNFVFAMNHPLGGMDALALVSLLDGKGYQLKFIVNDLLLNLENMSGLFVGVDKHKKNSNEARKKVNDLFKSEYVVGIFPAGLVSRQIKGKIEDLEWKKTFVTLAKESNRRIVPVYIEGKLTNFFYRLANIRKFFGVKSNIEMLYLSDEMFRQRNKSIHFTFGKPIDLADFENLNDRAIAQEIKKKVYELKK